MHMLQGSSHNSVKVDRGACMCIVGTHWLHRFTQAYVGRGAALQAGSASAVEGCYQYQRCDKDAESSGHLLVGAAMCCMRKG